MRRILKERKGVGRDDVIKVKRGEETKLKRRKRKIEYLEKKRKACRQ